MAVRLYEGIGVGREWTDPAGRLRSLPYGTRLPPPPPLDEEIMARARTAGQVVPPYPMRPLSPSRLPVFGPQTYAEYMAQVEEDNAWYNVWG
ncbi:hypothetical protein CPLU01_08408 [Colletotrichum plurivorum]|uniref:Uncharacterized protein n=1 Tax=Colletotrichum plurivorum TaxID=2175906 RepID=A0A8H6KBP3_9PEZI|nr:hypothetical protein CPLU01_08408 [Colletotrichum plurivorum]